MLKWPGSIQCSLLIKYMLSLNKNTKLDYCNAVLHGKVMGIYSQSLKKISASAGVKICLANLAKDQNFL